MAGRYKITKVSSGEIHMHDWYQAERLHAATDNLCRIKVVDSEGILKYLTDYIARLDELMMWGVQLMVKHGYSYVITCAQSV